MRLALLFLFVAIAADAGPRVYDRTCGVSSRRSSRGGVACATAAASFSLSSEYLYPSASTDYVPLCTDDPTCVAVCGVGVRTGSLTAWECKGNDGAAFGTVVNSIPGSTVTIHGIRAMEVSHAGVGDSPELQSATLDALVTGASAFTVMAVGMPRTNADNYYWWLRREGGTSGKFNMYSLSAVSRCAYNAEETTQTGAPLNAWGFLACSKSGQSSTVTYQYDNTTTTFASPVASIVGTGRWIFGNRTSEDSPYGNLGMNGPMGFFVFYNVEKTAAEKRAIFDKAMHAYNASGALGYGPSQRIAVDNTATSGNVDMIDSAAPVVESTGLVTSKGFTNVWAADPLAAATWTDVGTPTVTNNTSSGPFAVWKKAAECDLITDDDGAAFEGKQSGTIVAQADAGIALGYYNASCFLKGGDAGTTYTKARLAFSATGGTLSVSECDFTGLTATASRKQCITRLTGAASDLKASVVVGNAAAETGSIQACHCQLTAGPELEPPQPNNTAVSPVYYTMAPVTDGWPTAASGIKYEVVHAPKFDPLSQWISAAAGTYYLFDPNVAGGPHAGTLIFGYQNAGDMYANGIVTSSIGLTVDQAYATGLEARPSGGKCNYVVRHNSCGATSPTACLVATQVNADTTGTLDCLAQPDQATIGVRQDGSAYPLSTRINAVRVYSLP